MNIKELIRNSKLVIYTCIIGEYDYLKDPEYIDDNCDYICFTNNPKLKSDIWQIRFIENRDMNVTKWQRHYKLFPNIYLSEYDLY